jgi:hypothetical protein
MRRNGQRSFGQLPARCAFNKSFTVLSSWSNPYEARCSSGGRWQAGAARTQAVPSDHYPIRPAAGARPGTPRRTWPGQWQEADRLVVSAVLCRHLGGTCNHEHGCDRWFTGNYSAAHRAVPEFVAIDPRRLTAVRFIPRLISAPRVPHRLPSGCKAWPSHWNAAQAIHAPPPATRQGCSRFPRRI